MDSSLLENLKDLHVTTTKLSLYQLKALEILKQAHLLSRNDFFLSAIDRNLLNANFLSQYTKKRDLKHFPSTSFSFT
ncbi:MULTISPECIES: hypothetical protein [unclassified Bartonella]|uniref:hypothetical protein n=1 Tax=Bartonella TaxID=773 RepID=UPI0035CFBEAD